MRSLTRAILPTLLVLFLFAGFVYADVVKIATDQQGTGASSSCTLPSGYTQLTIKTTRGGSAATIGVECNVGDGAFIAIPDEDNLPLTGTADIYVIQGYACYQVRINVSVCTECTVNAWCAYNLVTER